jgi:hypothetical protein
LVTPAIPDGEDPSPYGAEIRATWSPPDTIDQEMLDAAAHRRQVLSQVLEPAGGERVVRWLAKLGAVCATTSGAPAAMDKLTILASVLEDEAYAAFSNQSLKRAVKRFKWFPEGHDLIDFAQSETEKIRGEMVRLDTILNIGVRSLPPKRKWTKEMSEAYTEELRRKKDEERRELARILKERDASASQQTAETQHIGPAKPLRFAMPQVRQSDPTDDGAA